MHAANPLPAVATLLCQHLAKMPAKRIGKIRGVLAQTPNHKTKKTWRFQLIESPVYRVILGDARFIASTVSSVLSPV